MAEQEIKFIIWENNLSLYLPLVSYFYIRFLIIVKNNFQVFLYCWSINYAFHVLDNALEAKYVQFLSAAMVAV